MKSRLVGVGTALVLGAALLGPAPSTSASPERSASPAALRSDFDGDGFADLAIGAPLENVGSAQNAGAVTVIEGSTQGLGGPMTTWTQDTPGVPGTGAMDDRFGTSLATGDFDGDGFADLAIGVLLDEVAGVRNAGAVNVLYGSAHGLTATGSRLWHQDSPAVVDTVEEEDRFGNALATGDFDGDGKDDLAVGVSEEDVGTLVDAGAVVVLPGSPSGLTGTGSRILHQDRPGVVGQAAPDEQFGSAVAAGNLGHGGFDDLAVGARFEDVGNISGAGIVTVLYGSSEGLTGTDSQSWSQNSDGMRDVAEPGDSFGGSLAIGNVGGAVQKDLVVGVALETLGSEQAAGAVQVIYGSLTGLTSEGNQFWSQDSAGVNGTAEARDFFGSRVTVGNLGRSQHADVVVGVPSEDAGAQEAGVVNVLYGSATGVTAEGNEVWYQGTTGIAGGPEEPDLFGSALAIGSYGRDTPMDLAVGVQSEALGLVTGAGAVNVIYGSPSGLTATGNHLVTQDDDGSDDAAEQGDNFGTALAST